MSLLLIGLLTALLTGAFAAPLQVVTENWRPYNYIDDGIVKGTATKIVRQVLEQAGIKYNIEVYPWARAYKLAQQQKNLLIYSIIRIPSRDSLFKWVRPLGRGSTTYLYRLKKNPHVNPTDLGQARQYQVITSTDSMDHLWLRYNGFTLLHAPGTVEQMIKMFHKNRADMIAIESISMADEFNHYGFDASQVVPVMPLFTAPPYIAVSLSTSDEMVEKLRKAYDTLLLAHKITLIN